MPHIENIFLAKLHEAKVRHSSEALERPKDKTEFGYGQASGVYHGLLLAEQLFNNAIGEEEDES